jgi:malate/lactate dehydrogenase
MPGILGRNGVSRILEPAMTEEERKDWSGATQALGAISLVSF